MEINAHALEQKVHSRTEFFAGNRVTVQNIRETRVENI
jgi:hypothetical protein